MPLKQLSDAIILCVLFESDVTTLKSLCIVCRNFKALIEAYGKSIHAKALAKAYEQDLVDCVDKRWRERNHLTALFVTDGRVQEARWMAAVRLRVAIQVWPRDWAYHPRSLDIVPIWEHVVMGVGIMWRLQDCATQKMGLNFGREALYSAAYMSDVTINYPLLEYMEKRILDKQIAFVEGLTIADRGSLYYGLVFCVRVLYQARAFTPRWDFEAEDFEHRKDQWIKWLALREGPAFVATAWRSEAVKGMHSELIGRALTNRISAQMDIEMAAAKSLYEAVKQERIGLK